MDTYKDKIKEEAQEFDKNNLERIKNGFVPDLRNLQKVDWFYNNVWRDPKLVDIHLMPIFNFMIDAAKRRGGNVLEVGCGMGYLSLELARNGLNVIGVDVSEKSIEIAEEFLSKNEFKENFGSLRYVSDDIVTMDLENDYFDTIVFFGSLHHLPDVRSLMKKLSVSLKKGGNVIIFEPIRNNIDHDSAEFLALMRAILPTWIGYDKKLNHLNSDQEWAKYVDDIYNEIKYLEEHEQSPMDNITDSEEVILQTVEEHFNIKSIDYSNSFIDKLIGGIRGENTHQLAAFLKFLDGYMVRSKKLSPTAMLIHAVKE
ncbi:MAG: class I SAM-dependent methyltransferase [Nanoarchaeota archaeon]|mgnify:CR=1 FL=1